LVVVAPHPDDEVLIASGLILKAIERHEPVSIIIVTAGDFDCRIDAQRRQAESRAGLAALGVSEQQIFFLGYPDGSLGRLGEAPLQQTPHSNSEQCPAHRGSARDFTAPGLVSELQALLASLKPKTLVVTHPEDTHPDHAATYVFVRRALNQLDQAPRVLRAFVHTEDCWPTGGADVQHCLPGRIAPSEPTPALTGTLSGYEPDVRVSVPTQCLAPSLTENPKLRAIAAHVSQTRGDPASYLLAFARNDEVFFSEDLTRDFSGKWTPLPAPRTPSSPDILIHAGEKLPLNQSSSFAWTVKLRRPQPHEKTQLILMSGKNGQ
jgi:LmbE family N-acetylglucosaminyl deacetylase